MAMLAMLWWLGGVVGHFVLHIDVLCATVYRPSARGPSLEHAALLDLTGASSFTMHLYATSLNKKEGEVRLPLC